MMRIMNTRKRDPGSSKFSGQSGSKSAPLWSQLFQDHEIEGVVRIAAVFRESTCCSRTISSSNSACLSSPSISESDSASSIDV
uniref:Uncharacterized protein n=1 Tax=Arundo donax TaxID=35708 RepID=A0A0A8Z537_ARUDO